MTSKTLKSAIWLTLAASAVVLASGGVAYGKGKPISEASQNLSVPAIMVGGVVGTLNCPGSSPGDLKVPEGTPRDGYEVSGYYWVQKVHAWQAQCFEASSALVFGAWGDNLAGDAKLKAGSPIRVELVLTNQTDFTASDALISIPSGTLQGYNVIKLQPSELDRLSAYGHLADGNATDGWDDIPVAYPQFPTNEICPDPTDTGDTDCQGWVVHDAGMQISVQNLDTGLFAVPLQPIAPEINATGKIVYGYNLRVTAPGNYRIRFNAPNVTFTGTDVPNDLNDDNNAYLDISVIGGGGNRPR